MVWLRFGKKNYNPDWYAAWFDSCFLGLDRVFALKILARFKLGFVEKKKKSVLNFELTACACDAAFVFEFIKKNDKSQNYYYFLEFLLALINNNWLLINWLICTILIVVIIFFKVWPNVSWLDLLFSVKVYFC